jgi:hypothetical protein
MPILPLLLEFSSRRPRSSWFWGRSAAVVCGSGPLWGRSVPYGCIRSPPGSGCVYCRLRRRLPVTASLGPEARVFNIVVLFLVPARRSGLPLGSWCKLLHQPPAMSNHIYRSSVCSSDRGFTSPTSTDALRGIRLGASILDASAFPPSATPSTPSPWTPASCCSLLPGLLCNSVFFGGPICNLVAVTV